VGIVIGYIFKPQIDKLVYKVVELIRSKKD